MVAQPFHHPDMSGKTLPSWDPASNHQYSFDQWRRDMMYWSMFTDIDDRKQGPAALMRLGGLAREFAHELNSADIQNGALVDWGDGAGPVPTNAVHVLIYSLSKRFEELAVETSIRSINGLWNFSKRQGEAIDMCLSRFEILKKRAGERGQFGLGITGEAWLLVRSLHIPPQSWGQLLAPSGGTLPTTDEQYRSMLTLIRRTYHLYEGRGLQ